MPRYKQVRENGVTFVFKYDDDAPELLHIYARHLTTIDDALDVYFDPTTTHELNTEFDRHESRNATHGLFWFFIHESQQVVMVITCFRL